MTVCATSSRSLSETPGAACFFTAASAWATTRPASRMASSAPSLLSSIMMCSGPVLVCFLFRAATQMPGEEPFRGGIEAQPVRRLGEPVTLVGEQHVLVIDSGLPQRRDDLLRLRLLHPRVVGALRDQQRRADAGRA